MANHNLQRHVFFEQERRRAKFLTAQAIVAAFVLIPLAVYNLAIGYIAGALLDGVALLMAVGIYIYSRLYGFCRNARIVLSAVYLVLFHLTLHHDGQDAMYWASLLMVTSFLLFSRLWAVGVSVALIISPFLVLSEIGIYSIVMFTASHLFLLLFLFSFIESQNYWDHQMLGGVFSDTLTHTLNRKAFEFDLSEVMQEVAVNAHCLVLLDIDHFKKINDTYGHVAGDSCLARFAAKTLGMVDGFPVRVYRYGGEEFALLTALDLTQTTALVERLRASVARSSLLREVRVTVSAGIACLHPGEAPRQAVLRADAALYRAKNAGRNCVEVAPPSDSAIPASPGHRAVRGTARA